MQKLNNKKLFIILISLMLTICCYEGFKPSNVLCTSIRKRNIIERERVTNFSSIDSSSWFNILFYRNVGNLPVESKLDPTEAAYAMEPDDTKIPSGTKINLKIIGVNVKSDIGGKLVAWYKAEIDNSFIPSAYRDKTQDCNIIFDNDLTSGKNNAWVISCKYGSQEVVASVMSRGSVIYDGFNSANLEVKKPLLFIVLNK